MILLSSRLNWSSCKLDPREHGLLGLNRIIRYSSNLSIKRGNLRVLLLVVVLIASSRVVLEAPMSLVRRRGHVRNVAEWRGDIRDAELINVVSGVAGHPATGSRRHLVRRGRDSSVVGRGVLALKRSHRLVSLPVVGDVRGVEQDLGPLLSLLAHQLLDLLSDGRQLLVVPLVLQ